MFGMMKQGVLIGTYVIVVVVKDTARSWTNAQEIVVITLVRKLGIRS